MSKLRVVDDCGWLRVFDLTFGGVFGRDPGVEFVVDHETISRKHAEFTMRNGEIEVRDLGSANRTFVNHRLLDERPYLLEPGDKLQFGALSASFISAELEADETILRRPRATGSRSATVATTNVLEHQLKLGRLAQRRMLVDRPPNLRGYEFGHALLPALGVGGDFIYWGIANDGRVALVVGDVCGKGVAAALYMAFISGLLVEIVPTAGSAEEVLSRANGRLEPILEPGMFATAFAMLIDPLSHAVEMANAGHAPAVLKRSSIPVAEVAIATGLPLGAAAKADIGCVTVQLEPGDFVTVTTDGVDEAQSTSAEEFGRWRVLDVLARSAGAIDAARRLQSAVKTFATGAPQHDDISLISVERCI